jgi:thiol-disulfide isomerase/thioredoxin
VSGMATEEADSVNYSAMRARLGASPQMPSSTLRRKGRLRICGPRGECVKQNIKLPAVFMVLAIATIAVSSLKSASPVDERPFVLVVYADWCPSCQQLKPVLALLNEKYQKKIRFVRYNITSEDTAAESKRHVAKLGLAEFFDKNHEQTSLVVIMDGSRREIFRTANDYDPVHYEKVLDRALEVEPAR